MFAFKGDLEASKSWMNRALVIQHFNPHLKIKGKTSAEDVIQLQNAISKVGSAYKFDLGQGGTTFRFFFFLISRSRGLFTLRAHERLLARPQQEISKILKQLGVDTVLRNSNWEIKSVGWQKPEFAVECSADLSSQFISALLLSAWQLDFDLEIVIKKPVTSVGYLQMTVDVLHKAGMQIVLNEKDTHWYCKIPKNQKSNIRELEAELDISSAFSLAAAGVVNGDVQISNWNSFSAQPDLVFLDIFNQMQIAYEIRNGTFKISKHNNWSAADVNLQNSPDLFPVLAVLTALGNGTGKLSGAKQLKYKESDRILKTYELLSLAGFKTELLMDGLIIHGKSSEQDLQKEFIFNPDHDHRMAMAAALLKLKGFNIIIESPEVVNKSYPAFWQHIGLES